jgi:CHASE2 domain-containing sensor protein
VMLHRWVWLLMAIAMVLVILVSMGWLLFLQGVWIPIVPPILTLLLSRFAAPKLEGHAR